jgi:hypothetical protein
VISHDFTRSARSLKYWETDLFKIKAALKSQDESLEKKFLFALWACKNYQTYFFKFCLQKCYISAAAEDICGLAVPIQPPD